MPSRRTVLRCSLGTAFASTVAGCSAVTETSEPESRSYTEPADYPVLIDSLTDERRPVDAYVFLNDALVADERERDHEVFRWDELTEVTTARLQESIDSGEDLLVVQTRVSFDPDATTGLPIVVEFEDDHTAVRPRYDEAGRSEWQGPESWETETGSVMIRSYESIPEDAAERVRVSFDIRQ
ncbi:hypothetical protein [Natrialba sp. SSL1]|uniref:hypothetical protein n=1 Tax=Natrialba sp. SSL1 TaxID=1869245 RepID=UPI000AEBE62A|nr:hypothetical protein [Natrialba sp. SSL1]